MTRQSRARSPIPWFGGKQKLADDIIAFFPAHDSYIEAFGGGASVLLSKPPVTLEIYNDRDGGLVLFFRVLRDQPEKLVPLLELTPYSRGEWQICRETWQDPDLDEVERARRWFVVASQSFGGMVARAREGWSSGSRSASDTQKLTNAGGPAGWKSDRTPDQGPNGERHHGRGWGGERLGRMHLSRAASTANRVDHIWKFVERLRLVQIENLEWRVCLERYDSPSALFYLDPPYIPETRRAGGYNHELSFEDHVDLIDRVLALQGCAIVSGYDHELYRRLETEGGYTRTEFSVWASAGKRTAGNARDRRTECLWAAPTAYIPMLFTQPLEAIA